MKLYFVDAKEVKNIVELAAIKRNPNRLLQLFLNNEWDIIYIFSGGELKAIASIGDIYRWAENGFGEFVFNTNFSYVSEIDFLEAGKIFNRIKTIYEVPVVREGKLVGVIRKKEKHTKEEWEQIHARLASLCKRQKGIPHVRFMFNEMIRWKKKCEGIELYIYRIPSSSVRNYLSDEQRVEYDRKDEFRKAEEYDAISFAKEHGFSTEFKNVKVLQTKGCYYLQDYCSDCFNEKDNIRVTPNASEKPYKIFFIGPCTIWGAYVDDDETIEYYIQEEINKRKLPYEVVNCGLPVAWIEHNLFIRKMRAGDKVVIASLESVNSSYVENELIKLAPEVCKVDLSEVYSKLDNPTSLYVDTPYHCNGTVNKKIAERIWDDFCKEGKWLSETEDNVYVERKALQDYYIPYEIYQYFDEYMNEHMDEQFLCMNENYRVGAIVMNCNPFTLGHRYLIEKAAGNVDFLCVFVVEEDKSYYSFADRLELVKRGTVDLLNVKVLPSGKFILSKETFEQYFDKESITEVKDMSWDIRIFGEVVAQKLGITYRFVGEEPKDIVTREYNETMKKILPEYGITVIEIPRICTQDGNEVISATTVRKLVQKQDWEALKKYCPMSTVEYLLNKSSV